MEIFLKFDSTLTGLSPHPVENLPTYRYLSVREAFKIEEKSVKFFEVIFTLFILLGYYHTRGGGSELFFLF